VSSLFLSQDPATTDIYTLSLHDALPICLTVARDAREDDPRVHLPHLLEPEVPALERARPEVLGDDVRVPHELEQQLLAALGAQRSEEHTSELQSLTNLVCRLLLEKKNTI